MLQTSLWRNSLVPKRNMDLKLPSQRLGLARMLALYRMTAKGEGSVEFSYSKAWVWLSASMLLPHVGWGAGGAKLNVLSGAFLDWGQGGVVVFNIHVVLWINMFSIVYFGRRGGVHGRQGGAMWSSYTNTRCWSAPLYVDGGVSRSLKGVIKIHNRVHKTGIHYTTLGCYHRWWR